MILFRIALRNILATKVRTLIIGLLIVFGTALVVLGGSLFSSLEQSMARSIIGSVSGHFQVFDKEARDTIELFAPPVGTPRIGEIRDFPKARKVLSAVHGVRDVVPMGNDFATVFSGNIMDITLERLREAVKSGDGRHTLLICDQIRRNVNLIKDQLGSLKGFITDDPEAFDRGRKRADLEKAVSDEFWADFDSSPEDHIVFLENRIAQLAADERMLFLSYIGTDTKAFTSNSPLFEIVKGVNIPAGQRGFLFSDFVYERQVKHLVAGRLDRIKEKLNTGLTIAEDKAVSNLVQQNVRQYKDVLFQMDTDAAAQVMPKLAAFLGTDETDQIELLKMFLDMNDDNFAERYDFFYKEIAPHTFLYQMEIGDTLTIQSFTRRGYPTSVNVKVYGTFRFSGLEKSALAGAYSLMDLQTYRDLYGNATDETREELKEMRRKAEVKQVARAEAEDALFGSGEGPTSPESPATEDAAATAAGGAAASGSSASEGSGEGAGFDEFAGIDMSEGGRTHMKDLFARVYTQEEIDNGVTPNASIVLEDGTDIEEARVALQEAIDREGLSLKLVDWKAASGFIGKFIDVIWIVLVVAIFIIFLVALVIINNSMVMATLDRAQEIGTMRAIGARRGYVLKMFLLESSVLGLGFGVLGVLLGTGVVILLNSVGIPAASDELYFLFAGPRLRPILLPEHLVLAFVVVFVVSMLSTLYPAWLAARVAPVRAMGKED